MPKLATYLAEVSWIEVVEYFNVVVVIVVGACGDVGRCVGVDFVAGGADARDRFLEAITTEKQILSKKKSFVVKSRQKLPNNDKTTST